MSRCAYIKPGGERCGATAMKGYEVCYGHREDLAEERQKNASRGGKAGGRGRSPGEVAEVRAALRKLAEEVREGAVDTRVAAVLVQLYNARRGLLETEVRLKEQRELEERLSALEAAARTPQRGGSYARPG